MKFAATFITFASAISGALALNAFSAPAGNTTIKAGDTFIVRWNNTGAGKTVDLLLKKGPADNLQTALTIITGLENQGAVRWHVPSDLVSGNDYSLEIKDESGDINYTPQFTIDGVASSVVASTTSASSASESSASATSASTTSASASSASASSASESSESSTSSESESSASTTAATSGAVITTATNNSTTTGSHSGSHNGTSIMTGSDSTDSATATGSDSTDSTSATGSATGSASTSGSHSGSHTSGSATASGSASASASGSHASGSHASGSASSTSPSTGNGASFVSYSSLLLAGTIAGVVFMTL